MSLVKVRAALETALNAITPTIDTAWENASYTPVSGTPYQQVNLLAARPENPTFGDGFYRENGYLQISLCYPIGAGPVDADTRAELLRTSFPRAKTLLSGGVTVVVSGTPEISPARIDGDRYVVPVKIPFFANINGTNILLTEQGGYLLV